MKRTLQILFNRWPETAVLVVLTAGAVMLFGGSDIETKPPGVILVVGIGTGLFVMLSIFLTLGFLRTVCDDPEQARDISTLFIEGKRFVWRVIWFQLAMAILAAFIASVVMSLMNRHFLGNLEIEEIPMWAQQLSLIIALLVLLKPLLLTPALIVVTDCSVLESMRYYRFCPLLRSWELLGWILAGGAILGIQIIAESYVKDSEKAVMVIDSVSSFVMAFIQISIQLAAVRYVINSLPTESNQQDI